jgi:hypothetical protein
MTFSDSPNNDGGGVYMERQVPARAPSTFVPSANSCQGAMDTRYVWRIHNAEKASGPLAVHAI